MSEAKIEEACLLCNKQDLLHEISINKKNDGDNVITFTVCASCMKQISEELKQAVEQIN